MRYSHIVPATFLSRPNRFIAQVELEGEEVAVHVKNTGRCKELLVPGTTVYLEKAANSARKTPYDIVTVDKGGRLINMDAQAPNKLFQEWALAGSFMPGLTLLRPETTWGNSRFDFYWEAEGGPSGKPAPADETVRGGILDALLRRGFVEVKGCTLEEENWTFFPDAPTERGVKHLEELLLAKEQGYEATLCVVIQMAGVDGFSPNDRTHPAFGEALRKAAAGGVEILAYECDVKPDEICITTKIPVKL